MLSRTDKLYYMSQSSGKQAFNLRWSRKGMVTAKGASEVLDYSTHFWRSGDLVFLFLSAQGFNTKFRTHGVGFLSFILSMGSLEARYGFFYPTQLLHIGLNKRQVFTFLSRAKKYNLIERYYPEKGQRGKISPSCKLYRLTDEGNAAIRSFKESYKYQATKVKKLKRVQLEQL